MGRGIDRRRFLVGTAALTLAGGMVNVSLGGQGATVRITVREGMSGERLREALLDRIRLALDGMDEAQVKLSTARVAGGQVAEVFVSDGFSVRSGSQAFPGDSWWVAEELGHAVPLDVAGAHREYATVRVAGGGPTLPGGLHRQRVRPYGVTVQGEALPRDAAALLAAVGITGPALGPVSRAAGGRVARLALEGCVGLPERWLPIGDALVQTFARGIAQLVWQLEQLEAAPDPAIPALRRRLGVEARGWWEVALVRRMWAA